MHIHFKAFTLILLALVITVGVHIPAAARESSSQGVTRMADYTASEVAQVDGVGPAVENRTTLRGDVGRNSLTRRVNWSLVIVGGVLLLLGLFSVVNRILSDRVIRGHLKAALYQHLGDELGALCAALNVDCASLPGGDAQERVDALVDHMYEHNRIKDLLVEADARAPEQDWDKYKVLISRRRE